MPHAECSLSGSRVLLLFLSLTLLLPLLPGVGSAADGGSGGGYENPLVRTCAAFNHQRRLYVSTVDGVLTALDTQGHVLWKYSSPEPLFTSSLSHRKSAEDVPDLIPALNKALYHWDGSKLQQLPFSAEDLIDSTHLFHRLGSALVGAKSREVVGINIHTGEPVYECSQLKCHRYDNQSRIQNMDVLKMTTSRVTVREANEHTGEEMWNFTVGDLQLSLVEGVEEGEEFSCNYPPQPDPLLLQVDTVKGVLYAIDSHPDFSSNYLLWKRKLSAPIVNVWLHEGGRLGTVDLTSHQTHSEDLVRRPELMLVLFNNQYYIQSVGGGADWRGRGEQQLDQRHEANHLPEDSDLDREEVMYPKSFSLSLQTPQPGPTHQKDSHGLTLYYDDDTFLKMCTAGPNGPAVYFHVDESVQHYEDCSSAEENGSVMGERCPPSHTITPLNTPQPTVEKRSWLWRALLSVAKYVFFGAFVLGLNKLHRYHRLKRSPSGSQTDLEEEFPLFEHVYSTLVRKGSGSLSHLSSSSNSSSTESLTTTPKPLERTLSRFGSDYELKGRLGKGGFGVVYHVRNKTDGGEYAVKRIKLPNSKSARDKVMREVHALAQLDHPRIVRYFHSWVEKAPSGWNEMEEWIPLSRRQSVVGDMDTQSGTATPSINSTWSNTKSYNNHPVSTAAPVNAAVDLSPCPSFNSLNHSTIHSVVPPRFTADSRSSSFVIEFAEDSQSHMRGGAAAVDINNGCFSHTFLTNRDDLSTSTCSESTEGKEDERRDSITALGAEPPTYLFIQMQLCQKESLKEWLATNVHNRRRETIMHFFAQILDAVLYVHRKGMMHRDLKPSNIFFSLDGNVKVGDFGLVTGTAFGALHNSYVTLISLADRDDHRQHTGNIGSHLYMSPELVSSLKYDKKVDIFSLGIIFFELHYPFSTEMERTKVLEDLRNQKFPPRFKTHLPLEAEFVEWLTAPLAADRPSAKEIFSSERLRVLKDNALRAEVGIIPKL